MARINVSENDPWSLDPDNDMLVTRHEHFTVHTKHIDRIRRIDHSSDASWSADQLFNVLLMRETCNTLSTNHVSCFNCHVVCLPSVRQFE